MKDGGEPHRLIRVIVAASPGNSAYGVPSVALPAGLPEHQSSKKAGYQGWLTEDQRYLYVNDELDEIVGTTERTRTLIYDVAELDDPILVAEHLGPDQATDHNLFIAGNRAYLANYQAGFRVLDITDPERPVEIGWFDTTPYGENPPGFGGGAWTAWPFFESGMVVIPVTIHQDQTLADAFDLMQQHRISGIPVVDRGSNGKSGKLVGILTNRDVRFATYPRQPVSELMTRERVVTVR